MCYPYYDYFTNRVEGGHTLTWAGTSIPVGTRCDCGATTFN